jgi:hypothetical protein
MGNGAAGSPKTVRDILGDQAAHAGLNYVACQMYFGDMTQDEATRSASLFATQVADLPAAAARPHKAELAPAG